MKIGMVGCGKLGLMVALTIETKGHDILGYDIDPSIEEYLKKRKIPFMEEYSDWLLKGTNMQMVAIQQLVYTSEIIFMAVQTPHAPLYEGITRIPNTRSDFDYSFLKDAVKCVNDCLYNIKEDRIIVIISTVLPGTIDREIKPLINCHFKLIYEPLFIAMGTAYQDYLNPEFVLVGYDKENEKYADKLEEFYKTIHNKPIFKTDIRTAEAIKVFYNTFVTMKTVLGNIYGEMAYKLGANVDDIYKVLSMATDRIISPKYLKSGMGDGGGCHPRDNIALSFIANKINLSFDIFDALMKAREYHTEWLASLMVEKHKETNLPIIILGKTFKHETNLIVGSPAILLANILREKNIEFIHYDPYIDNKIDNKLDTNILDTNIRAIYFIATKHNVFKQLQFPKGSIIIDPFRYIEKSDNIELIQIGKHSQYLRE